MLFEQYIMQDQTHSLFNSKTIERLWSDILISKRQRNVANEWLHLPKARALYGKKELLSIWSYSSSRSPWIRCKKRS
jgi:hypothetical protein